VSVKGDDANKGTLEAPLKTISAAAQLAQPGDTVTVHEGIYRERVSPPRGGTSDEKRIVYQAAQGEKVEIRGSEEVKNWEKVQDDTWKAVLPNSFFGGFNPYSDLIHGDWFNPLGREHHTGAVYLNGDWLMEAAKIEDVLKPIEKEPLWFGKVEGDSTTIWAQFKGVNPNEQSTEINVRRTVFYPEKTGVNYITVRGFSMKHAATPWAPPTAEQMGLIGAHWSKGWIIENNEVSFSKCSGISLGKYGDEFDNTSADTAEGYVKTIERALQNGWNKETVGHHVVRKNRIHHCEQTGVVGSLGAVFSTISGNTIHDIHVRQLFTGAEMAGIKLHAAIDVEISGNHIYKTCRGLWLDWMAQGTRVSRNVFYENQAEDLFVEVDHGPFLVDSNVFVSPVSVTSRSQGGAYVHNLFCGEIRPNHYDERQTPFHVPHSTELAGMHDNPCGDDRYYNNVFVEKADLRAYDDAQLPVFMAGNVYVKGAKPSKFEPDAVVKPEVNARVKVEEKDGKVWVRMTLEREWNGEAARKLVTTELLGETAISKARYEEANGTAIRIDRDFVGEKRNASPMPGPFEQLDCGDIAFGMD
jgi:alpha-N-arabinofuranosidase